MKKCRILFKTISIILSVIIVLQILPFSVIAASANEAKVDVQPELIDMNATDSEPKIVGEVISLRGEYIKHFRREDGSFVAAIYNEPIHYRKNDTWEEVDNTIQATNNKTSSNSTINSTNHLVTTYSITKTANPITFPSDIKTGKIAVNTNGKSFSFGVKDNGSTNSEKLSVSSGVNNKVSVSKIEDQPFNESINDKLAVDTNNNKLTYNDAFDNAYLTYEASASMLKESIVIPQKSTHYSYDFTMDFGEYIPVYDELTNGIYIYENAESLSPIMAIAPPYMYDAKGETSVDVNMELKQNDGEYTLTVTADKNWINSSNREFPVIVDPTLILDIGRSGVYDAHVNSGSPDTSYKLDYQLEVGRNNDNIFRTYLKYDLPELPDCSVVTNAMLTLEQNWLRTFDNATNDLLVYSLNTDWNFDTITWNTQPVTNRADEDLIDYTDFIDGMSAMYTLNITKAAKKWYESGVNYGLMLCSSDETIKEKTSFYSSRNLAGNYPYIIIEYVNNNGIESYWDYESISLGDSGTAYINTYNGGLTYIHNDENTNGLAMPASVSHVYSTGEQNSTGTFGNMKFGKGFKLNIIEKIEAVDSEQLTNYPFKYIDADSTVHFFMKTATENQYVYEFGTDTVLTSTSTGYTMSFADGSKKLFNTDGYLIQIIDTNGNDITINYSNGRITQIFDTTNMSMIFSYNEDNTLAYINNTAGGKITFTYSDDGLLTAINYPDGNKTQYDYGTNSLLQKITTIQSYELFFAYKTVKNSINNTIFYRIWGASYYGSDDSAVPLDSLTFTYRTHDTVVNNSQGDEVVIAFDSVGRAVNKTLNGKNTIGTVYNNHLTESANGEVVETPNINNTIAVSSNIFSATENLIAEPYVAYASTWNVVGVKGIHNPTNSSTSISDNSMYLSESAGANEAYIHKRLENISGGESYTVSARIRIPYEMESGGTQLKLVAGNSTTAVLKEEHSASYSTTNGEWIVISTTIETPENSDFIDVYCGFFDGSGEIYIEYVCAEKGRSVNRFNIAMNSSFSHDYDDLTIGCYSRYMNDSLASIVTDIATNDKMLKLTGSRSSTNYVRETYYHINGKLGDTVVYGASAKALCSSSGNNGTRYFGMKLILDYVDDTQGTFYFKFNEQVYDTWQTAMSYATAAKDYDTVKIELHYDYEVNSALFDDVFVYRDSYATHYNYDNDTGLLESIHDDSGNSVDYVYTGIDVTKATAKTNGTVMQEALYSYDSKHNLLSAENSTTRLTTSYTYNSRGLPLTVTVTDEEGQHATTTYTYNDYDYLTSVTDTTGATTQYSYTGKIAKGLVTKVTDPNGNVTEYTYNSNNDLLTSISNPDSSLGNVTTYFGYTTNRHLITIENQDIYYCLGYDTYGRSVETVVSDNFYLTWNNYNDDGNLASITFGNESVAAFEYDEDDRVIAETYDGVKTYEYSYTNEGQLNKVTDHENNMEWNYQYDLSGRLMAAHNSDNKMLFYSYNDKNQPERVRMLDGEELMYDNQYSYDSTGRISGFTANYIGGTSVQNFYDIDAFGRINSFTVAANTNNTLKTNYSYITKNGNQTGMVDSIEYLHSATDTDTNLLPTLSYEYDANGNITHIYENGVQKVKYYYDSLNRMIREDNADIDKTVVYNYDSGGDILSKIEYALTDSTTLGTPMDTINYQYNDYDWRNGVTLYDGTDSITYDYCGNPVNYRGYTMTWAKGKQLSTMTKGEQTLSFKYDANGIRTKKTVNNVEYEYTYVGDKLVRVESDGLDYGPLTIYYTADGKPYSFYYGGGPFYYMLNLQGDVIGIATGNGNVIVEYAYDSWGKPISVTVNNSIYEDVALANPLRYRGYVYDSETELYYLQSRYYDPELCRFISADAYLIAGNYLQGTNMFAYCLNNPVRYSDPSGYEALSVSEQAAVDVATIFFYLYYFATVLDGTSEYSIADYVKRISIGNPSLTELSRRMSWSYDMFSDINALDITNSVTGVALNIIEIAGKSLPYPFGDIIELGDWGVNIFIDFFDPRLENIDLVEGIMKTAMKGAGNAGFVAIAAAFFASPTGLPVAISGGLAILFVQLGSHLWNEAIDDL